MYRKIFLAAMLASMALASELIVCTPDFCNLVDCQKVTPETCKKQNKEYQENISFCGCCNGCVDYLDACDKCSGNHRERFIFRGGPPPMKRHCKPGLACINGHCLKIPTW